MRALGVLLLAPSLSLAAWNFESYLDGNGVEGFRTFHDGVEQYDQAPDYSPNQVVGFSPVAINDSGWLVGNAYVLDIPAFHNEMGWDALMFTLNPAGGMEVGLWTGAAHWMTNDGWACVQEGPYGKFQMMDVTNGNRFDIKNCSWTPVEGEETPHPENANAVPEPHMLLLTLGMLGAALLLRSAAAVPTTRRYRASDSLVRAT